MKLHYFFSGLRTATMDLDKKLPNVIKTYPDAKIEKGSFADAPCIKGKDLVPGIRIVKLLDKKVDIKVNIDLYAFSKFCYAYFDLNFDINYSLIKLLMKEI